MTTFAPEQSVRHPDHGEGRIVVDQGVFSLVQFGTDIHRVETAQLMRIESLEDRLADLTTDDSTATLAKAQALVLQGSISAEHGIGAIGGMLVSQQVNV